MPPKKSTVKKSQEPIINEAKEKVASEKEIPKKKEKSQPNLQPEDKEKIENILITSGILDAYEYLLKSLCKHGLPKGNVYEFAAQSMLKFEKKIKKAQASMKSSRVEPNSEQKVTNDQFESSPKKPTKNKPQKK